MLTLYQAEWCPYSSAVRERLTELGLPFVAVPVEPTPERRDALRGLAGTDEIPVLQPDDGGPIVGTKAIFGYLATLPPGPYGAEHRRRYEEHRHEREAETTARLLRDLG
jgi:glutathione S-transferase